MKRVAFTMLELILVIVVLGILAAVAIPRMERDVRQEAGDNILSAIRYTQHLALIDNKANVNDSATKQPWQKAFWQIRFVNYGGEWQYIVASNTDYGANLDQSEAAIDVSTGKFMHTGDAVIDNDESPSIFLSKQYGISNVDFTACTGSIGSGKVANNASHIGFDYLGRPHKGLGGATYTMSTLMHADCVIIFQFEDGSDDLSIQIRKETGYANIVDQNAS